MDRGGEESALLQRILAGCAALGARHGEGGAASLLAVDEGRDQYPWLRVGWAGPRRVYGVTVHAWPGEGRIWIEQGWTEDGLATELRRAGVPGSGIVLACQDPEVRIVPAEAVA